MGNFPYVEIEGNSYEIGFQEGRNFKDRIKNSIECYKRMFMDYSNLKWDRANELSKKFIPIISEYDNNYIEEIKGVAEGSNFDFEDILALNCRSELVFVGKEFDKVDGGCTSIGINEYAGLNGNTYVAHNWDWKTSQKSSMIMMKIKQKNGKPTIFMVTEAGIIGKTGFNSAGLSVFLNALSTNQAPKGLPIHIAMRKIMDCETISEAISAVTKMPLGCCANFMLGHKNGECVNIEIENDDFDVLYPKDGIIAHTNHFLSYRLPKSSRKDTTKYKLTDSFIRLGHADRLIRKKGVNIDENDIIQILKDHVEYPNSICRHNNEKIDEGLRMGTIFSMIVNLTQGKILFCDRINMTYTIGYGKEGQTFEIPEAYNVKCINPNKVEKLRIKKHTVEHALDNPIGTKKLEEIVKPEHKIVIVTSDITRPMPSYKVLPSILKRLKKASAKIENISIIFALGSHRRHTEEEKIKLVGEEVYKSVICKDSSEDDFINMGKTSRGTPILINRIVAEADIRICLGNIEYHYFAGYSGGAKAIMPGVSNREAIQSNHSKMVEAGAEVGRLEDNPVRLDIEEAIKFCNINFILNVILDEEKEIVHAVAGDYIKAHREGCRFLDKLYMKKIKEKADIVIASQGGYPKDLNLYQTQKALANAVFAVKEGGIIILAGSCIEGFGEYVFETWMKEAKSPEETIKRVQVDFQLGGHKAAAIGLVLQKADIYLVSEMDEKIVKDIFMHPYKKIQKALEDALKIKGKDAKIIIMPYAGSTLPVLN